MDGEGRIEIYLFNGNRVSVFQGKKIWNWMGVMVTQHYELNVHLKVANIIKMFGTKMI